PRRHRGRRRATIQQPLLTLLPVAAPPLRDRAHADAGGLGRRPQRPTLTLNPIDRQATTVRTGPRVSVQLHPAHPPWELVAWQLQPPRRPGWNNPLRNYSGHANPTVTLSTYAHLFERADH